MREAQLALLLLLALAAVASAATVSKRSIFRQPTDEEQGSSTDTEPLEPAELLPPGPPPPPPSKEKAPASKKDPPPSKKEKPPKSQETQPTSQKKPPPPKKPPKSQEQPPASKEKPPKSQETPPASQKKPPPKKPPKSQETPPASQKKPPPSKEKPPKSQEKPPKSQEKPPKSQEKPPKSQEKPPKSQEKPPKSQEKPPKSQEKPPKSQEKPPKSQEKPPKSQEKPPKSQEKPPKSQEKPPKSQEKPPKSQEKPPKSQEKPPKSQEKPPKSQEKPPKSQEKPPKSQEKPPKSQEKPPKSQEKPPKSQEKPPKSQEKPPKSQEKPPKSQEKPPKSQEKPPKSQEKPPKSQEKPPKSQEKPPKSQEKPPKSQEKPPKSQEKPPKSQEKPPKSQEKPPKSQEKPPKSQEKPPKSQEKPPKSQEKPPKSHENSQEKPPASKENPPKIVVTKATPTPKATSTTPKPTVPKTTAPKPELLKLSTPMPSLPPVKDETGCGACRAADGRVHRVLLGFGCVAFEQEVKPGEKATTLMCPQGFLFDAKECGCRAASEVKCPTHCMPTNRPTPQGLPSSTKPPVAPTTATKMTPTVTRTATPSSQSSTTNPPRIVELPSSTKPPVAPTTATKMTPMVTRTATPSSQSSATNPPRILELPPTECGACQRRGTWHRVKAGEGCRNYHKDSTGGLAGETHSCAPGYLFDPYLCFCNYEHVVKCPSSCDAPTPAPKTTEAVTVASTTPSTTPQVLSTPSRTCGSCLSGGVRHRMQAGDGCKLYTADTTGDSVVYACPSDLLFDPFLCVCNYAHAFQCPSECGGGNTSTAQPSTTEKPTTPAPTTPAPTTPTPTTPAPTTAAPPKTQPPIVLTTPPSTCDSCFARGVHHHVTAGQGCKHYTLDTTGSGVTYSCPGDLLFDTTLCMCNYPHVVKCPSQCGVPSQPPLPSTPATTTTAITFQPTTPGVLTMPPSTCGSCFMSGTWHRVTFGDGCKHFTKDATGDSVKYACRDGLLFDPKLCICNYPHVVKCPSECGVPQLSTTAKPLSITAEPMTSTTQQTPLPPVASTATPIILTTPMHDCGSCLAKNGVVHRVSPGAGCKSFTKDVAGGGREHFTCPDGRLFDPVLCMCNYPHVVRCPDKCGTDAPPTEAPKPTPISSVTAQTTLPPTKPQPPGKPVCSLCTADGLIFEVVTNTGCSSFIQHAPGVSSQSFNCPPNLVFDTNLCACNWKEAVTCSKECGGDGQPPTVSSTITSKSTSVTPQSPVQDKVLSTTTPKPTSVTPSWPVRDEDMCGSCKSDGIVYRLVRGSGCRSFTMQTAQGGSSIIQCPVDLTFDLNLCVCNHAHAVTCSNECSTFVNPPTPSPITVATPSHRPPTPDSVTGNPACGTCTSDGIVFEIAPDSGCKSFITRTPGFMPALYHCPDDLLFDANLCVCNWKEAVSCSGRCEGRPPANTPAALTTPKPNADRSTIPPDPKEPLHVTGCGVCSANGGIYRPLPNSGCRKFTEEAAGIAPTTMECPPGLLFDTQLCVCNYDYAVTCTSDCGTEVVTARPTLRPDSPVTPSTPGRPIVPADAETCGSCEVEDMIYEVVAGTGCTSFVQRAPGIPAQKLVCSDGLLFDTHLCVCNWKEAVQCSSKCGQRPPGPVIVTTSTQATSPKIELPPNDLFDSHESGCGTCQAYGNTYRAVKGTSCRAFTEETAHLPARRLECPPGLVFDTTLCVCNYEHVIQCSSDCTNVPKPPVDPPVRPPIGITDIPPRVPSGGDDTTVTVGCGQCQAGGSVYRTIAGSGCMAFSEEAPGIAPRRLLCPDGLVFDTNLCVCNWHDAVTCSSTCEGRPPGGVVVTPPSPTLSGATQPTRSPQRPDQFIPQSGCGVCKANGNTYRALPGCRSFTEENDVMPPRKLECSAGLVFDTTLCFCNYACSVKCAADCSSTAQPPTQPPQVIIPPSDIIHRPPIVPSGDDKVTVGCGQCQAGGNTYRTISGSDCMAFTEEAPGIAARRLVCPDGLVFDTNLCVCNWRETVQCSSKCQGQPPSTGVTTPKPQPATGRPPTISNDLFVPQSGCGVCKAEGNTYRVLAGCRTFTEESDLVPARALECPPGLLFDTTLCVCNYDYAVKCSSDCKNVPQPPTQPPEVTRPTAGIVHRPTIVPGNDGSNKVTVGCGHCEADGSIYRTIAGTACTAFTVEAQGVPPKKAVCPDGLLFDTNLCVCNWPEAVQCSSTCQGNGQKPTTKTEIVTAKPPVTPSHIASGCGVCKTGCTVFRVLEDSGTCNAFMEETEGASPVRRSCPSGLVFDAEICMCSWQATTKCNCGTRPPTALPPIASGPIKVPINPGPNEHFVSTPVNMETLKTIPSGCGTCSAAGNIFRTVPGTGCARFTVETASLPPAHLECASGLVFDVLTCGCNRKEAVICTCVGDGKP